MYPLASLGASAPEIVLNFRPDILFRMTLDTLIMFLGAFVVLEPQLGFPTNWDNALLFIVGVLIIALGIAVRRRGIKPQVKSQNIQAAANDSAQN